MHHTNAKTKRLLLILTCCAGIGPSLGCGQPEAKPVQPATLETASASMLLEVSGPELPNVAYGKNPGKAVGCRHIYEGSKYSGESKRVFPKGWNGINSCEDVRAAIKAENAWSHGDEACAAGVESGWTAIHGSEAARDCRLEGNNFVVDVSACCEDQLPMCPPGNREHTSLGDGVSDDCDEAQDSLEDSLNGPYNSICGGADVPDGIDVVKYECTPPGNIGNTYANRHTVFMLACCDMSWPVAGEGPVKSG